jgi:alkylation response protein AidB-like acyl-CoA dehydrogenase
MEFALSEEQEMLEASLRRYLDEEAPTTRVREIMASDSGHDETLWKGLAELGIAGLLVPEEFGGSQLALLDAAVAAESLGRAATPAPFLSSAVMAPLAIAASGGEEQQRRWLPEIAGGRLRVGMALNECFSQREGAGPRLEGERLQGKSLFVLDPGADAFLVAVEGERLAWVPRDTEGLGIETLSTIDLTRRFGELVFEGAAPGDWLDGAPGSTARLLDAGRVVLAADILGACERAIDMSVEYAKQREQFGRPIGSFQAVKHMCAEMVAELEPARSLVWYAAHAFDALPQESALAAAHAKAHLSEIGTRIVATATEVHGGIGFTDEHDLHLWFKRVGVDRQLLGTPDGLRAHAASLQGWGNTPH